MIAQTGDTLKLLRTHFPQIAEVKLQEDFRQQYHYFKEMIDPEFPKPKSATP